MAVVEGDMEPAFSMKVFYMIDKLTDTRSPRGRVEGRGTEGEK